MPYYSWFSGHGRTILADEFGIEDPFDLHPADIVDRILAAGYTPDVNHPHDAPFRGLGLIAEVERNGVNYLVSISKDAEEIGVQEWRDVAYDPK